MPVLFIKYIGKFGLNFDAPEDEVKKWLEEVLPPMWAQIIPPPYGIEPSVCGGNSKEAKNMSENKKPRLAEVLGVEVGEKFNIMGAPNNPYFISGFGWLVDKNDYIFTNWISRIINDPELIKRRPRWTEQEIKDAKNIIRMFGEDRYPYVIKTMDGLPYLSDDLESLAMYTINLEPEIFPSLKCGETVRITDIIGGNI